MEKTKDHEIKAGHGSTRIVCWGGLLDTASDSSMRRDNSLGKF
jgi:hypothetical protein